MQLKKKFMVLAALAAMGVAGQAQTYTGTATTIAGGIDGTREAQGIVDTSTLDPDTGEHVFTAVPAANDGVEVSIGGVTFDATTLPNSTTSDAGDGFSYSINVAQKQFLYTTANTGSYDYVTAGSYISRIPANGQVDTVFVVGEATPESAVPTTGTATYDGGAIVRQIVGSGASGATATTAANFAVDFGSKALTGTIAADGAVLTSNLALAATISGNSFSGSSTATDLTTQGNFYGPNAEELGGVFQSNDLNVVGAFAASKQ